MEESKHVGGQCGVRSVEKGGGRVDDGHTGGNDRLERTRVRGPGGYGEEVGKVRGKMDERERICYLLDTAKNFKYPREYSLPRQ